MSKHGWAILKYTVLNRSIWYKTSIAYVHTVIGIFIYHDETVLLNNKKEEGD